MNNNSCSSKRTKPRNASKRVRIRRSPPPEPLWAGRGDGGFLCFGGPPSKRTRWRRRGGGSIPPDGATKHRRSSAARFADAPSPDPYRRFWNTWLCSPLRYTSWCLFRGFFVRPWIFEFELFFFFQNWLWKRRSRKERSDSNRFIKQKASTKSTNSNDDRRRQAISSTSSASCLSSSSPSSSSASSPSSSFSMVLASSRLLPSVSGSADAKKLSMMQIAGSKKPLPPAMVRTRNYRSVTAPFLFLSSLTLMVFYGRLCAILWMSSCFCYVARRSGATKEKARGGVALRPAAAKAAEIKRRN